MITKRIFRALTITATMIISSTIGDAQRINREGLHKLYEGSKASPAATMQAPALESNVTMEPEAAQEPPQGVLLNISAQSKKAKAIVGSWLETVTVAGGPTFKSLSTYTEDGRGVFGSGQCPHRTALPPCFQRRPRGLGSSGRAYLQHDDNSVDL